MNNGITHTPTPWSLGMRTATYGKIMCDDTERPCIAHVMQIAGPDGKPDAESLANAAHIVRCVNERAALLDFLATISRSGCLDQQLQGNCICFSCEAARLLHRATQED